MKQRSESTSSRWQNRKTWTKSAMTVPSAQVAVGAALDDGCMQLAMPFLHIAVTQSP